MALSIFLVIQAAQFCLFMTKFIALKPPLGFGFKISACGSEIEAENLKFIPLCSEDAPESLGVQVFVPGFNRIDKNIEDMIRVALSSGIGEKAAAALAHVEVSSGMETPEESLPIDSLSDYINWHTKRPHRL